MTTTPTRRGLNPATRTSRRGPARAAIRSAPLDRPAGTTWGATLTLATRSPAPTTWPSNRVNSSSGSIRSIRSTRRGPDVDDAVVRGQRSTRLSAGPRSDSPGPRDGGGQPRGGLILVEVARLDDEDGDPGRRRASAGRPRPGRRVAPGSPGRRRSAGGPSTSAPRRRRGRGSRTAPARSRDGRRPGTIRSSRTRPPGQSAAASAASIARRTSTRAISAR